MASLARAWALGGLSKQRPASSDLNAQGSGNINRSVWLTYQGLAASLSKQAVSCFTHDEKQSPQEHLHPGLFALHPPGSGAERRAVSSALRGHLPTRSPPKSSECWGTGNSEAGGWRLPTELDSVTGLSQVSTYTFH